VKRVIGLVFICGAASCVSALAAAPAPTHQSVTVRASSKTLVSRQAAVLMLAPADEYFGPLKLSILGIRNTIRDLGARYDVNHDIGHQTFTSAQLTERAIHDWEHRYPRDGQVPKAIYLLQRLYAKVLTQEARDRANATAQWMFSDYSASPQGKQLKKILAVEHLPPVATPAATPAPASTSSYPSTFGPGYRTDFGTSTDGGTTQTAPTPAAAPVASPLQSPSSS
jgi:hypothetical protein